MSPGSKARNNKANKIQLEIQNHRYKVNKVLKSLRMSSVAAGSIIQNTNERSGCRKLICKCVVMKSIELFTPIWVQLQC